MVGCAIGTVRSRLHRARGLLAARIAVLESRNSLRAPGDQRTAGITLEAPSREPETAVIESAPPNNDRLAPSAERRTPNNDRLAPSAERRTPSGSPGRCLA